jgi:hypothetical protein
MSEIDMILVLAGPVPRIRNSQFSSGPTVSYSSEPMNMFLYGRSRPHPNEGSDKSKNWALWKPQHEARGQSMVARCPRGALNPTFFVKPRTGLRL